MCGMYNVEFVVAYLAVAQLRCRCGAGAVRLHGRFEKDVAFPIWKKRGGSHRCRISTHVA